MYIEEKRSIIFIMDRFEVIVIGAGPAGVSSAMVLARAGKKVLLVERGDKAGDKNVFGGKISAVC